MLKNYLKVAFRTISRNKIYAFINIIGLTIGISAALLIFLYVQDELTFDRHHSKADRIHRIYCKYYLPDDAGSEELAPIGPALAQVLMDDYPEVESACRFHDRDNSVFIHPTTHEELFEDLHFADSGFFQVFDFGLKSGNPETALNGINTLVISEKIANKYFGTTDVLGKEMVLKSDTVRVIFTITGILEDIPSNSHLQFDMISSLKTLEDFGYYMNNWWSFSFHTYLLLQESVDAEAFGQKVKRVSAEYILDQEEGSGYKQEYYLQNLPDIHLHSDLRGEISPNGKAAFVYMFILIGIFLVIIACINFMNLATARSMQRAREVGIRKTVGALREQLIGQFMGESTVMTMLALIFSVCLTQFVLPFFNEFTEKSLSLNVIDNPLLMVAICGIGFFVAVVSGFYPAFFLSGFDPVKVMRGRFSASGQGKILRKILVVCQFTISVALIAGTLLVFNQLNFMKSKELGFAKDNTIVLPMRSRANAQTSFKVLQKELEKLPEVAHATISSAVPGVAMGNNVVRIGWGQDAKWSDMRFLAVDESFVENYQLELVEGRFFDKKYGTDEEEGFLLNEAGVKRLGYESPQAALNQKLSWQRKQGRVIGVVKDFHFMSVSEQIQPFIMVQSERHEAYLSVKLPAGQLTAGLQSIEAVWKGVFPNRPFEYDLLDASFDQQYKKYERFYGFFSVFAAIAIFIACLGLFGLAAYTAQTRTKEIGIRKVHGASVQGLILLLSREFTALVIVAFFMAIPIVYFSMEIWLEDFAYRVAISPMIFVASGIIAMVIAWLTVSYHATRAAMANPVEALKYE